jgi:tetratricopeptide (TPR) repeat protein
MELTLDQALQKGIEAHKAGRAQEADRYYTAIIKANPKHPDANHNMGVLAIGVGKVQEALPFFKTALETNPSKAQYWLSYIDALIKLDRKTDAKILFDQAKSKGAKGDGFDKLEKSLVGLEKVAEVNAISQKSQEPPKNQLKSIASLNTQGQHNQALNQALQLQQQFPKSFNLFNIIGAANKSLGKLDDAIVAYQKALSIKPDLAETYYNMGNALKGKCKLDEAIGAYNKALAIKPDFAEAYNNMGNTLQEQGKLEEAIEAFNKALALKPDYAAAILNTTELLKTYSPKWERSLNLFNIDSKIKKLSPRILHATSNEEIIDNIAIGLNYITEESFEYKTPLSQIYKRNTADLNCKRHKKIFDTRDIIPEFCFGCFKVQVEVGTFIDLVRLTSLFYKFDFEEDLARKTMIELRPNISGYYKGLFYCNGLDQAEAVKSSLDASLKETFGAKTISIIKRGCSEYPLKFPSYGEISKNQKKIMSFPKEWTLIEKRLDQDELIKPKDNIIASLPMFCLSDFYIIQKWIDYAKGIGDQSIESFNDRPIIFKNIYAEAKIRSIS